MSKEVLIVNSETEDLLDNFNLKDDEELVIQKQAKKLTPKQKRLINEKNDLKKFCNKQGGFVHMFYINGKLLFHDLNIDRPNISRLIYLATYLDYNDRQANLLIKYGKNKVIHAMTREEMRKLLKLSVTVFDSFLSQMKENNIIYEVNNKFYIDPKYFSKGKRDNDKSFTRVFISTTRHIYENCTPRQHKTLSYIYQLIPFMNFELNILCRNPLESDFTRLKKLNSEEICKLLGISTSKQSVYKFRESLKKFYIKIDGRKYYLISYVKVANGYGIKDYYVINPAVIWGGNSLEENRKTLSWLFFNA